MKFNFKKIAPIFAGAILLGSTIGFASVLAADVTYPSSFSNAVVVVGDAAADDSAASLIAADLSTVAKASATGGITGENVKIEGADKLQIGRNLSNVKTTLVTKSDLPNLLAKKTYLSKDGVSYDYEQEIKLASGLTYTVFSDIDYNNKIPTLGIAKSISTPILNYTLRFIKTLESDVDTAGKLEDIQDRDITILGKTYKILNAVNGTNLKLELMGGAVNDIISVGGNKTYTLGGKTFNVELIFVDSTTAKLRINGETTSSITEGSTYKLVDGTQLGIRDILYQAFTGGTQQVEFTLGAEKTTLEDNQKLKLNDETVNDVTVYITEGNSGSKRTISDITLAWITNDKIFMTSAKEGVLPGLKSVKITMADATLPKKEIINIDNAGERTVQLRVPIKSGTATIPLLTSNSTKTGYNKVGDENFNLRTGTSEIIFNRTIDRQFVGSYASTTTAESYLLRATISKDVPTTGQNSTDIIDSVTGSTICDDKKAGDQCTIGNVVLNINKVDVSGDGVVNITAATSSIKFNELYSNAGLKCTLPIAGAQVTTSYQNLNTTENPTTFTLLCEEADKNSNLGSGKDINVTLGITTKPAVEVNNVVDTGFAGTTSGITAFDVGGSATTSKYVAYLQSDLATKLTYDTKPDQNTLEIEYHGGEVYGNVYVATAEAVLAGTVPVIKASDVDKYKNNYDLVVVGGSAVNKVAADLLKLSYPTYGTNSAWTTATGVSKDMAIVKLFSGATDAYVSGKIALLVAGYDAKDTLAAAKYLIANKQVNQKLNTASATNVVATAL